MNECIDHIAKIASEEPEALELLSLLDDNVNLTCDSEWCRILDKAARVNFYSYDSAIIDEMYIYYKNIKIHYNFSRWDIYKRVGDPHHYRFFLFTFSTIELQNIIKMCKNKNIKELINFI